jgi:hypothetical protein
MPIYERYENGHPVPGSRQLPEPGMYDDTRLGLLVLERRESGERDGWYVDGEWAEAEALRQDAGYDDRTVEDLRDLLRERDMSTTGNKAELVMRLQAADLEATATETTED